QNTTTRIQGGVDFKISIIKGLTNTTRLSGDYYHIRRDLYFPRILPRLGNNIGSAELGNYDKTSLLAEDFLEYKYNLTPESYIEAIGGVSYQKERLNTIDLAASGFGTDQLKNYNFNSASSVSKPLTNVIENTIVSAFARVRLNL
ncbi:MAG TPA: SusC/RagA family TonB-linked outer membrane protein, partial [Niastella sp.]